MEHDSRLSHAGAGTGTVFAAMQQVLQNIMSCENPPPHLHYVGMDLHLHRVHFTSSYHLFGS